MPVPLAEILVAITTTYLIAGAVFALVFVWVGVQRVDPAARAGATWGFRLCLLPGCVALWPWLAWRWVTQRPVPSESNAHRDRVRGRS